MPYIGAKKSVNKKRDIGRKEDIQSHAVGSSLHLVSQKKSNYYAWSKELAVQSVVGAPSLFTSNAQRKLQSMHANLKKGEKVLGVIGAGTSALTYLYTEDFPSDIKHIVIVGDIGYWEVASHRLAQPHHILALPNTQSYGFVDPAKYDTEHDILPHQKSSSYVHSVDYQARLRKFTYDTILSLKKRGIAVYFLKGSRVSRVDGENGNYMLSIEDGSEKISVNKVIVATGAGPARALPKALKQSLLDSAKKQFGSSVDKNILMRKVLDYTDILSAPSERVRGKKVVVYGGGATAAWAMEVGDLSGDVVAWVARSGFDDAESAGPRVAAIINKSRHVQHKGELIDLALENTSNLDDSRLKLRVRLSDGTTVALEADYLINCIGQEQYQPGGLPEMLSERVKTQLEPYYDPNYVSGVTKKVKLGWATPKRDLFIIGAAQGTYYKKNTKYKIQSGTLQCVIFA